MRMRMKNGFKLTKLSRIVILLVLGFLYLENSSAVAAIDFSTKKFCTRFLKVLSDVSQLRPVTIELSTDFGADSFKRSKDIWDQVFDASRLEAILKKLKDGKKLKKSEISYIQKLKDIGTSIRHNFELLSVQGAVPENFQLLIKSLGQLKDLIGNSSLAKAGKKAKALRKFLKNYHPNSDIEIFLPAGVENIRANMLSTITEMKLILSKITITAYEFHKMKKTIRSLILILENINQTHSTDDMSKVIDSFKLAHKRMGDVNSSIVKEKIERGIQLKTTELFLPHGLKSRLEELISKISLMG